MCQRVPVVRPPDITKILGKRRRKRADDEFDDFGSFDDEEDFFDEEFDDFEAILQENGEDSIGMAEMFSVESYPDPYCEIVDGMATACLEMSILELWANDGAFDDRTEREIEALTIGDVIEKVNSQNKSGLVLIEKNFTQMLSGISRDFSGRIVGAKAVKMIWIGKMNTTSARMSPAPERGEPVAVDTLDF